MQALTFAALAAANNSRYRKWHMVDNEMDPDIPNGMGRWSLSDWCTACLGELGEAANFIKKLNRHKAGMAGNKGLTEEQLRFALAEELADVAIYLDLLAQAAGIDLGKEIITKFNSTSIVNGFPERLGDEAIQHHQV